ncbi:MAG: hypothetical protein WCH99_22625 [Verrucomicrobiota bacterium]
MCKDPDGGKFAGTIHGAEAVFSTVSGFYHEIADLRGKHDTLRKDAEKCIRAAQKFPMNQFWRRMMVKNSFAWFEGTIYGIKRLAIHQFERKEVKFSNAELAMLREEKYELDYNTSEAVAKPNNYPKFNPNLRFAFRCLAKSCEAMFTLDKNMMPLLKQFEGVRNRLTHPKHIKDLEVTNGELDICIRVHHWFGQETSRLFGECDVDKPANRQLIPRGVKKIKIKEPYVVLLSDGRVYEFRLCGHAKAFAHQSQDKGKNLRPLFIPVSKLTARSSAALASRKLSTKMPK